MLIKARKFQKIIIIEYPIIISRNQKFKKIVFKIVKKMKN